MAALPHRADAIRIVPLHEPGRIAAPPRPTPKLTYRGGPLIGAVEIFTLFWGNYDKDLADKLNAFFKYIVKSKLIDQLAEYAVDGKPIGHGSFAGTATVTTPKLGKSVSDGEVQHLIEGKFAEPSPNRLTFVFVAEGTRVVQGGSGSCQAFCGYHSDIDEQIYYAVMPYPGCSGCSAGLSVFDALTATSSHELCEAITDPVPGTGWYDDLHGEVGDICAWQFKKLGKYNVQLEWSNNKKRCA
jgi:hypothetical protein